MVIMKSPSSSKSSFRPPDVITNMMPESSLLQRGGKLRLSALHILRRICSGGIVFIRIIDKVTPVKNARKLVALGYSYEAELKPRLIKLINFLKPDRPYPPRHSKIRRCNY